MFSRFFIQRPVLANVIALLIVLLGAVAFTRLPIAQYPDITPPTIQVSVRYPGASAETVMDTVGLPIESQVNGVPGMIYMQSNSTSDGTYNLTVTFEIGTDPDKAQILVQNRVDAATAQLPSSVQSQGVTVRKRSTSILEFVTLSGADPKYDSLYLANYAKINLVDPLARVPGVGDVSIIGAGDYAMRIWLNADRMKALGLTPTDVSNAIKAQSQVVASGQLGAPPIATGQGFQTPIVIDGRLNDVKGFGNVVVKTDADTGTVTRLRDIARIELGSKSYGQVFRVNGRASAAIAISQLPDANALDVAKAVETKMKTLARDFPPGLSYDVPFNTTLFVNAAVDEVWRTLGEAFVIVLAVILLFLQDWRATLVPATTVPVTLIGAFAVMAALGFTINMSTLFALVLAIGIVVDDAIVVVEGAAEKLKPGVPGPVAAENAMKELFAPIVGITLVLLSVFLPAAFLPGLTGQLYQQFALVIAATALISAINAVTLKPVQAALWMKPLKPEGERNIVFRGFSRFEGWMERGYMRLLPRVLRWRYLVCAAAAGVMILGFVGLSKVPGGFLPIEDQGYFVASVSLPPGASLERTDAALKEVRTRLDKVPGVANVITIAGVSLLNGNASLASAGAVYIVLDPWDERGKSEGLLPMYLGLSKALKDLPDGTALVVPPPPMQGVGSAAGATMMLTLEGGSMDFARLSQAAQAFAARVEKDPRVVGVNIASAPEAPQVRLDVNRDKAALMGVNVSDVYSALSGYLGSSYVNQFTRFGQTFQVYIQAESDSRAMAAGIGRLTVPNASGQMVPLSSLVTVENGSGPPLATLYNLRPAVQLLARGDRSVSTGTVMQIMDEAAKSLPSGVGTEWTGLSYQEKVAGNQVYFAFGLALILVYLVLAGQYESWLGPLPVILSVPIALSGTVGVLLALGLQNTLYTQIGMVLLIALAAKNAILIVEYARDMRLHHDMSMIDAALAAGRRRLRPIVMTSLAFILGMVPLVLASGAGANASKSIGISVISGMLVSTALGLFVVPAMFVLFRQIEEWLARRRAG
ncbi:efflux RND transporter permease subunit [Acidimangrovimonas sediminis]|uniref:efflux RND transporter permease subunit n=1 Tax=Acidimangrovimonas sediminis TaxID=2056283 RepID=UPI000C806BBE|nr:efflux RND transporter permease subunit [Acidimangrovimonas sediminis]